MGNLTRRQILLGGGAIVGAGLVPVIPTTSGSSALGLISMALGADNPQPDQPIRLNSNENPYGPSPKVRESFDGVHPNEECPRHTDD